MRWLVVAAVTVFCSTGMLGSGPVSAQGPVNDAAVEQSVVVTPIPMPAQVTELSASVMRPAKKVKVVAKSAAVPAKSMLSSLREGTKPLHDQLMEALARDVASGALSPGTQLPPQRDLAYRLKIGVGTVTKVYAEARRRGLLTATVGRGSFVAGAVADGAADALIDVSRNLMTTRAAAARFPDALLALRRRPDLAEHLTYAPPAGMPAHRKAGTKWLAAQAGLPNADWQRLVVCEGGQHAMALAFFSLSKPGDTVLTEHATFFGMKALAEQQREPKLLRRISFRLSEPNLPSG